MKNTHWLLYISLITLFTACTKGDTIQVSKYSPITTKAAQQFISDYEQTFSIQLPNIEWNKAISLMSKKGDPWLIVPQKVYLDSKGIWHYKKIVFNRNPKYAAELIAKVVDWKVEDVRLCTNNYIADAGAISESVWRFEKLNGNLIYQFRIRNTNRKPSITTDTTKNNVWDDVGVYVVPSNPQPEEDDDWPTEWPEPEDPPVPGDSDGDGIQDDFDGDGIPDYDPNGDGCPELLPFACGGGSGGGDGGGGSSGNPIPVFDPNNPFSDLNYPINVSDEPILDNGIEVEEVPSYIPPGNGNRLIAHTQERGNTEDMQFGTNGDASGILENLLYQTNDGLFNNMSSLFHTCTIFDNALSNVGDLMIQKFRNRSGGSFENVVLNQKVSQSHTLINFLKEFGRILNEQLQFAEGNIDNISTIELENIHPIFNGLHNKFHGLQILVNDTEYTYIHLDNFQLYTGGDWKATVTVTILDHFGLDKHDALAYQGWSAGFPSWWLLQHTRGFVPFETVIHVRKTIRGHL